LEKLLRDCGDELTPENILAKATNMKNVTAPALMEGVTYNTTPTDYAPLKKLVIQQFDGQVWKPVRAVTVE
ncbi:MAG: branched-chain amino acid ABC transporter substrate-binding protein, partial [Rhodoblastus sp.]